MIVKKTLSDRVHTCPHCGLMMDRDQNAAINIMRLGLQSLGWKTLDAPDFNRGSSHNHSYGVRGRMSGKTPSNRCGVVHARNMRSPTSRRMRSLSFTCRRLS